ncbi:hypothetical protein G3O06_01250 [Burkholderia sp. Ac-20345]|uniref:hypothetical protein n=1 Tax=Burkholderia sp. Ac-20345 TaxID=2703891 RepID=UPI00197B6E49|nr:hypothetical protein [Burkholderia sp. Ac-20345]MBN3776190.1 hypothetical protein [Burkholderia sp. Ac-20345]
MADMDTNAIAQALKDLDWTSVPVRNREAIEQAIVALDRGDPNKLVANDAAAALTDERVEAAAIAMHAIRRDLAKGVGDLSFDMAFDTLPDEIKDVDRALVRAAILAASPIAPHEAAPAEKNTPIERLMDEYRGNGFSFADIEGVKRCALRYVQTMPDSQVRTLLYALAAQPAPPVVDERAAFDYDDVVSICDAHGICLPVDCVEVVVEIVKLSGLLDARASLPNAAEAEGAVDLVCALARPPQPPAQAPARVGLTSDDMRELKGMSSDPRLYESERAAIRIAVALLEGANHAE